jgi:hypothetical protein
VPRDLLRFLRFGPTRFRSASHYFGSLLRSKFLKWRFSAAPPGLPRPDHDALILITHPHGGKSFDYEDYWEGADLVYTGRRQNGDQELTGANGDVASNRRQLSVFENVGTLDLSASSDRNT